ncbi:MAG: type II secretion system F family protein [Treponema sp.]|nr:type II secretion system F family protein [Treponema sp.]
MPYYRCVVCNATGKKQEILSQAGSIAELLEGYAGKNDFLLSYKETNPSTMREKSFFGKKKHFSKELVREFTGIMAALLASGNTVVSSLELCAGMNGSYRGKLEELCTFLLEGIRKGECFSGCLLRCVSTFSPLYVALVRIGEKTGNTAEVFKRLNLYLATSKKIRTKVGGTLFYPVFVLISAVVGSVMILLFVLPRMEEIFSVFNTGGNSVDIRGIYSSVYLLISIVLLMCASIFLMAILHHYSQRIATVMDGMLLRLPFVGIFFKALESLDFCFSVELCSRTGMNIAVSLGEAQLVLRNRAYAQAVSEVKVAAAAGSTLSLAFLSRSVFPPVIGQWIAVGEQTGEAEMIFTHLRNFFEETVDSFTEQFLNGFEPVLMLLTGMVVLLLVLQFVLPLFSLYGSVF